MVSIVPAADPITDLLARDWAAVGGWALFLGLVIFVVYGAFREWWVPGPMHKREVAAREKATDLAATLSEQNGKLITSNEISKHFFEVTTPEKSPRVDTGQEPGGGSP